MIGRSRHFRKPFSVVAACRCQDLEGQDVMARSLRSPPGKKISKSQRLYVLFAPTFTANDTQHSSPERRKLSWAPSDKPKALSTLESLSEPPAAPAFEPYPPSVSEWPSKNLLGIILRLSLGECLHQQGNLTLRQTSGCQGLALKLLNSCSELPSPGLKEGEQS